MDLVDKFILGELMANCRVTARSLSKKLNLSPTSVQNRITKLKKIGGISRGYVFLSLAMLEADYCMCWISTDATEIDEHLLREIGKHPAVDESGRVGTRDLYATTQVSDSKSIIDLSSYIREFEFVQEVNLERIYPITPTPMPDNQKWVFRGNKVDFTKMQRTILKHLLEDARTPATEIAKKTNYSARRVQQVIKELQECGGLYFTVHPKFDALEQIPCIARITYDEKKISPHKVVGWIQEKFPVEYWNSFQIVDQPKTFHVFTAENMRRIEQIIHMLKDSPFSLLVETMVIQSQHHFAGLGHIGLCKLLGLEATNHKVLYLPPRGTKWY
ncbi:MAG: winged helix-turn-helix transcriptional regulator [Candidatus Thorarchaeota archaeon]